MFYIALSFYLVIGLYVAINLDAYSDDEVVCIDRLIAVIGWPFVVLNEKLK